MSLNRLKKGMLLLIAVAALIPFAWEPARSMVYTPSVEEQLYQLVSITGAAPAELNVQGWVKVKDELVTVEELEVLARKSAERMGAKNPEILRMDGSDFRQVQIQTVLEDGSVLNIAAQSLINYGRPEIPGETYVTLTMAQRISGGKNKSLPVVSRNVRGALVFSLANRPQVLTNIVAAKNGKMSAEEQDAMLTALFSAAEAQKIDGMKTEQLCSVTGFTSEISDSLKIGENQVNLNIAMRYHNDEGQTYIYLGSPLLAGEY